jgi:outer membrane protein assembly factor BamB
MKHAPIPLIALLLAPLATLHAADTSAPTAAVGGQAAQPERDATKETTTLPVRWGGTTSPNMVAAATGLPDDPGNCTPRWEVKLGTHQYSIPTIDRGRVYIGAGDAGVSRPGFTPTGGGIVMCVEQATGQLLWQLASPRYMPGVKPPFHFDQWKCGICSGPVVDGDRVYVVGNRGDILCLDRDGQAHGHAGSFTNELAYMGITNCPPDNARGPTDGRIIWRYDMLSELGIVPHDVCGSTLLIVGDLLYACTSNGLDDRHKKVPAPLAPTLIVLDKKTGRLVARDDEKIGQRLFHCNWSSPSAGQVNGRMLIFFGGGDGILYAFEPPVPAPDGSVQLLKKVWSYDCNPPAYRFRDGQPVPYSLWNRNSPDGPSEIIGTPVCHNGRVFVAIGQSPVHGNGHGCLSCVEAATGQKIWDSQLVDRTLATPAIADGLLYLPDTTGNLHCFDAVTGHRYWVHPLGAKCWIASAFVSDGKVYASTEDSVLWVLKHDKALHVLSRTQLKSRAITPTAVTGVLYLPTQRGLLALPGQASGRETR